MVFWIKHSDGSSSHYEYIKNARAAAYHMVKNKPGKIVKILRSRNSKEAVEEVKVRGHEVVTTRKVSLYGSYAWLDCPIYSTGDLKK